MNRILVVSLGYPTKENPYDAIFFKDQVDFIGTTYSCCVVVVREQSKGLFFSQHITCSKLEYTKGIIQYYPIIYVNYFRKLIEGITGLFCKKKSKERAVGIFRSSYYRNFRKKRINEIINNLNLEYDVVYCITAQGAAYYALLFSEIMNKPLIISEHRPYPHPGWATIDVEREAFNKADCFFAIGKDKIRQIMLQDIHPRRIAYVGNYIDENMFEILPVAHEYKTVLIIAAYSYFKNYDMFLDTMEKLAGKTKEEFRIIVAGYGVNIGYSGDSDEFEKKLLKSEVADKLELIREVKRNELCALYNRADAFVLTSVQEGQPMVCLEAASCGLPIFSTRCGGVEDYVTDEIGRLVDITDSDMLSEYLRQFIDGEITFDAQIIRNRVIQLYGTEAYMNNVKHEFDRLMQ